ncbi:PREDICTED: cardiotrophin-1 isoform X3 [Myotis brandtii]|uniref:cardiotrophin-1 isoform X3 n=1 Tax=Myotis brandtii TaxID=109478 RepID=UPI00070430FC|nr:PREDICTED: cardiotrophin-1 isoform X3 [Myotis brandtii]
MSRREGSLDPQADSSVSPLPLLEAKIHQTRNLARLLTKYAEQLFQEYVSPRLNPLSAPHTPAKGRGLSAPQRPRLPTGSEVET